MLQLEPAALQAGRMNSRLRARIWAPTAVIWRPLYTAWLATRGSRKTKGPPDDAINSLDV